MTPYLASCFFPTAYFGAVGPTIAAAGAAAPCRHDGDAFAAVVARLERLGRFDAVAFPCAPPWAQVGTLDGPTAVVAPAGWREVDGSDPARPLRTVNYHLVLRLWDDDPAAAFRRLDELAGLAQEALDATDLDGLAVAERTRLDAGTFDPARRPEFTLTLEGRFAYVVHR